MKPKLAMIEIIEGVEGQCIALNGTRIAGPKPWGGGRVSRTFFTDPNAIRMALQNKLPRNHKGEVKL